MPPFKPHVHLRCSSQWIYPAVSDSRCSAVTSFSLRVLIHFTLKSHVPRSELLSAWDLIREYSKEAFPNPEPAQSLTIRHLSARERHSEVTAKGRVRAQIYHSYTHHLGQGLPRGSLIDSWMEPWHLSLANSAMPHKLPPLRLKGAGHVILCIVWHCTRAWRRALNQCSMSDDWFARSTSLQFSL